MSILQGKEIKMDDNHKANTHEKVIECTNYNDRYVLFGREGHTVVTLKSEGDGLKYFNSYFHQWLVAGEYVPKKTSNSVSWTMASDRSLSLFCISTFRGVLGSNFYY